jgi:hypothetical protein
MLLRENTSMAGLRFKGVIVGLVASAMIVSSTAAAGATVQPSASQQLSPWAALTALTAGAPAATLCGAAVAATAGQVPATGCVLPAVDAPPPPAAMAEPAPAPAIAAQPATVVSPLFLALSALALGAAVYFLVRDNHHTISPA